MTSPGIEVVTHTLYLIRKQYVNTETVLKKYQMTMIITRFIS